MCIRIRTISNLLLSAVLILLLLDPITRVSARTPAAPLSTIVTPTSLVTTQGRTVGTVARLRTQNQSGTADTPTNYVLFQTPGKVYKGYRAYTLPAGVSPGTVTGISVKTNYKGPAKGAQTWSWSLYDWVQSSWVTVGDNTGARLDVWKVLQFSATGNAARFINNSTRQVWLQLSSNKALYDAKLDYEAITLTYTSCADALGCVLVPAGGAMHVAYLLNMPELETQNGASVAVDDAGGAILGHPIRFDGFSRPQCDVAATQADAAKLLADASILAILGTSCTSEAREVIPAISQAGFTMVSASNTGTDVTDPGTPGYLRVSWRDSQQGELAAEYAVSLGVSRASTINDESMYSSGNAQSFVTAFETLGGSVIGQVAIKSDQKDMRDELGTLAAGSAAGTPQLIYLPVSMPAGSYIVNQARVTTGLKFSDGVYLMGADGLLDQSLMLSTGSDLEGFRVTGVDWTQFAGSYTAPGGFIDKYISKYGVKPSVTLFSPYGYDAFNIIKAAIENAAVLQVDGSHLIGRQALRDALYATSGVAGITGTLTCHPDGDCAQSPALGVYQYAAGVADPMKVWP